MQNPDRETETGGKEWTGNGGYCSDGQKKRIGHLERWLESCRSQQDQLIYSTRAKGKKRLFFFWNASSCFSKQTVERKRSSYLCSFLWHKPSLASLLCSA